jgi:hypothetical protein
MPCFGWVPRGAVGRESVNLTVSRADEYGRAVHGDCYVQRLLSDWPTTTLPAKASSSRT